MKTYAVMILSLITWDLLTFDYSQAILVSHAAHCGTPLDSVWTVSFIPCALTVGIAVRMRILLVHQLPFVGAIAALSIFQLMISFKPYVSSEVPVILAAIALALISIQLTRLVAAGNSRKKKMLIAR